MQQITVFGRVGKEPESKTYNDFQFTKFSVAASRKVKGEDFTAWYNVTAFGKTGDVIKKYVHRGDRIVVSGQLEIREYDREDGTKGNSINIRMQDFSLVETKKEKEQSYPPKENQKFPKDVNPKTNKAYTSEDIPF